MSVSLGIERKNKEGRKKKNRKETGDEELLNVREAIPD